jgi:Family of unknown function (DUF6325)
MWEPPTRVDAVGLDQAGPIEYLIVEFPSGRIAADAFHQLLELAHDDRVRILDLEFVARDALGTASLMDPDEVVSRAGNELSTLAGVSSGLLDDDDVTRVGELISPGNLAAVVMYESTWVTAMAVQLRRDQANLISMGQLSMVELDHVLTGAKT